MLSIFHDMLVLMFAPALRVLSWTPLILLIYHCHRFWTYCSYSVLWISEGWEILLSAVSEPYWITSVVKCVWELGEHLVWAGQVSRTGIEGDKWKGSHWCLELFQVEWLHKITPQLLNLTMNIKHKHRMQ